MSKQIVLSNGSLHVGLDESGLVSDFYYPYVGLENHCAGSDLQHRIGVWINGQISWFGQDPAWRFTFRYPHSSLIGHIVAKNNSLGVAIEFDDLVDADQNAFIRNIHVINLFNQKREIRLFLHQAFAIGDSRMNTDTAQYIPNSHAILHYRGRRAFIVSGQYDNKRPFDQYSIGLIGIEGREGTWRDAEDGVLSLNTVEHGRVDSIIGFNLDIEADSSTRVQYWIATGTSMRESLAVHKKIRDDGTFERMSRTADLWHDWLQPVYGKINKLEPQYRETFLSSMMIIRSQIDKRGAVIASTDSSLLNYSRDAYAYCWPRDGALTLWPLIRMGYTEEPHKFFAFMLRGMHPDGYLLHKYRADGAIGSSWHTYVHENGEISPPIQEDETAVVLFMFAQFYSFYPERSILKEFYKKMVTPMADFLAGYIDYKTGLPKPSYDLWEQSFLTTTYTTALVYAALLSASDLAEASNDPTNAVKWRSTAEDIQTSAHKYLYDSDRKVMFLGIRTKGNAIIKDTTIDCSAVLGAYIFGLFPIEGTEIKESINTLEKVFNLNQGAPGLPRYQNDAYRRNSPSIDGNYWFVTTLWLAQYYIDTGNKEKAEKIINWVKSQTLNTGIMAEQFNPINNKIVAPAPLVWTHAEYVSTLLDLIDSNK